MSNVMSTPPLPYGHRLDATLSKKLHELRIDVLVQQQLEGHSDPGHELLDPRNLLAQLFDRHRPGFLDHWLDFLRKRFCILERRGNPFDGKLQMVSYAL